MIVGSQQAPVFCDCKHVSGTPCLPTCATYDLLSWRIFAPWIDRGFENWIVVQARTALEAIHAARVGYEPAHSIRFTDVSLDRIRNITRFHYNVDEHDVIVECT